MNRVDCGPLLLIVAGILLLLAVIAYVINNVERSANKLGDAASVARRLDRIEKLLEAMTPR